MQAAPPLLSFLLILLYHSGWAHGLCKLENSTTAWCDQLKDLKDVETHDLETLSVPVGQDVLIPGLFDNLTSLKHLDLSDGDLRKIESGSFRTLNNLKSLNLGDNRIEYLDLASLEGLIHLRSLNLRRNVIRQLPPALARLKNLKHLDIHGNPLECNCATLKVRDLIVQRGVTVSKKVVCAGPGNMKGTSLMKPSAMIICSFEEQDREMQNDQAEGSGESDLGSGDVLDGFNEEEEEEEEEEDMEDKSSTSEKPKESEVETPFPTVLIDSTTESSTSKIAVEVTTGTTMNSLHSTEDEEIFFDNEDKKEQTSTTEMSQKKDIKDVLFYPTTGSGDGDEGSGEGSGATGTHYDEEETERADTSEGFFATGAGFLNTLFGFGTVVTTSTTKEPNLEEEEFIHVSTTNLATEETIVSDKSYSVEAGIEKSTEATTKIVLPNTNDVVIASSDIVDDSKSGNMMDRDNGEQAVSSPKQSKKGMGSYVVLAVLLVIVVALIGFAAYRGDICKKRKSRDVETGTEMKEIQKSLLEHGENSTQPKKEENTPYVTEVESDPLVKVKSAGDDAKIDEIHDDDYQTRETPRLNGTVDHSEPVKPPRKQLSQDENAISQDDEVREERPQPNGPPLSPGAQRVKITLQEIPDSVPKTPILITRTVAGENLVKTP
ncbi:Leucine-rich repeat-containing protein 70 [Trachymyrmex septentrionalis]|uniref:Leucine-rich repeat-containing protein 70 n=1 Tax=Trachymyrmex septentrionalis TaxID=34720 RepID=A0A151K0R1_9HYME|nr:Leucine-rich repeat-containing protein 70 [Trachymyrmex septentrionalis]